MSSATRRTLAAELLLLWASDALPDDYGNGSTSAAITNFGAQWAVWRRIAPARDENRSQHAGAGEGEG